jgi:branched-subunit amino acid transport protein AzlD
MSDKAHYALVVLLAVGALSYLLRALPFLLFGGRQEPPQVVKYVGRVLSPAAIAMLVVYCYAGEIAKPVQGLSGVAAAAPYLAGALTVALQFWRRNPLVSILSGTALYMALIHL